MTDETNRERLLTSDDWLRIENDPAFRDLIAAKRRFIIPATIFFIVYFFALPILVGFMPGLMSRRVFGHVNAAYLFALSQFGMAWVIAFWYVRRAAGFDVAAKAIRDAAGRDPS